MFSCLLSFFYRLIPPFPLYVHSAFPIFLFCSIAFDFRIPLTCALLFQFTMEFRLMAFVTGPSSPFLFPLHIHVPVFYRLSPPLSFFFQPHPSSLSPASWRLLPTPPIYLYLLPPVLPRLLYPPASYAPKFYSPPTQLFVWILTPNTLLLSSPYASSSYVSPLPRSPLSFLVRFDLSCHLGCK